jgi:hypothetical protein
LCTTKAVVDTRVALQIPPAQHAFEQVKSSLVTDIKATAKNGISIKIVDLPFILDRDDLTLNLRHDPFHLFRTVGHMPYETRFGKKNLYIIIP